MNRDPIEINGRMWLYDPSSRTHRRAEAVDHNNDSGQAADVELPTSCGRAGKDESSAPFARASIEIVSYRTRLADADGISAKAAIDGIVMCGILRDDSPKEVSEVRYRQVKVKNESEEKTEIVITEV
jgi:hypothetical protein